ncbi:NAD(P)H-dependent oxidoreductase [Maricaulis sp.]|jgi:FMN-dependent NADH-azoreductase|uniref:FMN-dependent NADH-azoreductase n=1 Tax=Maricaulis sp. TaxID=1486257 RepID=UPI0026053F8D|nr:NAD(P)H-dependent oxidoreductase [Maricaulis sp.]
MTDTPAPHILRIDASMRRTGSHSRRLTDRVIERLREHHPGAQVTVRDLAEETPSFVDETWIGANFTDPSERSEDQRNALARSDALVAELKSADMIVIGMPIYNFSVPAALKAWVDMIARARETFVYTETGPKGLLDGKRVILVAASGGTEVGSAIDFATGYMKHVLGFVGITDVDVVDAGQLMFGEAERVDAAQGQIDSLAA